MKTHSFERVFCIYEDERAYTNLGDFMNIIFSLMIIASLLVSFFTGTVEETVYAGFDGAMRSVEIVLSFAGIMCMWSGFLKVAEESGGLKLVSKLISPLTKRLFKNSNEKAMQYITANISANLLGVGNAATPSGIAAMKELDRINPTPEIASDEMSIFTVINTASLQLLPTGVIALRVAAGSKNPQAILPAVWISSFCSVLGAVFLMKAILKMRARR